MLVEGCICTAWIERSCWSGVEVCLFIVVGRDFSFFSTKASAVAEAATDPENCGKEKSTNNGAHNCDDQLVAAG